MIFLVLSYLVFPRALYDPYVVFCKQLRLLLDARGSEQVSITMAYVNYLYACMSSRAYPAPSLIPRDPR